ncbi:hypothetical protein J4732_20985 [Serratia marcescens]|uniref:Uncharacterized protein n=1 Tax=Serratia marcescens TaxID=615 RepID=A0A939SP35_SERMA|nr:hypothetical protein [Serratia marcescens]
MDERQSPWQRSEIPHRRRAVHQPRPAVDAAAAQDQGFAVMPDSIPDPAGLAAQGTRRARRWPGMITGG